MWDKHDYKKHFGLASNTNYGCNTYVVAGWNYYSQTVFFFQSHKTTFLIKLQPGWVHLDLQKHEAPHWQVFFLSL